MNGALDAKRINNNLFELLVVDRQFRYLNSTKIDPTPILDKQPRPPVYDFVVHNKLVYALDMNCKCTTVYNEDLKKEPQSIPIPETLNVDMKDIHLAISDRYIFISADKTIYFAENNNEKSNYKKLDLSEQLFNITWYGEE